jgi:hypothetical protein
MGHWGGCTPLNDQFFWSSRGLCYWYRWPENWSSRGLCDSSQWPVRTSHWGGCTPLNDCSWLWLRAVWTFLDDQSELVIEVSVRLSWRPILNGCWGGCPALNEEPVINHSSWWPVFTYHSGEDVGMWDVKTSLMTGQNRSLRGANPPHDDRFFLLIWEEYTPLNDQSEPVIKRGTHSPQWAALAACRREFELPSMTGEWPLQGVPHSRSSYPCVVLVFFCGWWVMKMWLWVYKTRNSNLNGGGIKVFFSFCKYRNL